MEPDHTSIRVTPEAWKLVLMEKQIGENMSDCIERVYWSYYKFLGFEDEKGDE